MKLHNKSVTNSDSAILGNVFLRVFFVCVKFTDTKSLAGSSVIRIGLCKGL